MNRSEEPGDLGQKSQTGSQVPSLQWYALLENLPESVMVMDAQTRKFVFANQCMCSILGYTQEEILQMPIEKLHPPEMLPIIAENFQQLAHGERLFSTDIVFQRSDGSLFPSDVSSTLIELEGKPYFCGIFTDITQRKQAEAEIIAAKELAEKNQRFLEEAQKIAQLGYWELDLVQNHLMWSEGVFEIFGCTPGQFEATYEAFLEFIHPEDRSLVNDAYQEHLETHQPYDIIHRVISQSGQLKYVHERCQSWFDKHGKPLRSLGTVLDITTQKQVEINLRKSEEKYRSLIESVDALIFLLDARGTLLFLNRPAAEMWEKEPGEMVGKNLAEFFPSPEASDLLKKVAKVLSENKGFSWNPSFEVKGNTRWYRNSIQPIRDESGNAFEALIFANDITDIKRGEEKLKQSERNYKSLFFDSPDGYLILRGGRFIECNKASETIIGGSREDLIGKTPADISPEFQPNGKRSAEFAEELIAETVEKGGNSFEWMHLRMDGTPFLARINLSVIKYQGEQVLFTTWQDITAQRETEERLRILSQAVEQNPVSIMILNLHGTIEYANKNACVTSAYSLQELVGQKPQDFSPDALSSQSRQRMLETLRAGKEWKGVIHSKRKNGQRYWESVTVTPINNPSDAATHFIVLKEDITERKRIQETLEINERRFRQVAEHSRTVVWETDPEGLYTFVSPVGKTVYGYSPEELVGRKTFRGLHPGTQIGVSSEGNSLLEKVANLEGPMIRKDGKTVWLSTNYAPIMNKEGKVTGFQGTDNDITERKRTREELRKFRTISEQANYGNAIADVDGTLLYVNPTFAQMHGYSVEELVGKNLQLLHNEKQRERLETLLQKLRERGEFSAEEIDHTRKDGSTFPSLMNAKTVVGKDNRPLFMSATVLDITFRKETLSRLSLLSRSVEQSPNYIVITDVEGAIEYVNPSFTENVGYSLDEARGQNPRILNSGFHSEAFYKKLWDTILSGNDWRGEFRNKKKNGELYWENAVISPVFNEEGKITHFVAVKEDTTERKKAEKALKESEAKMRAISESAQDAIIMLDGYGNVSFWNAAAETLFGYTAQEILGKNMHNLLAPSRYMDAHRKAFSLYQKTGQGNAVGKRLQLEARRKDGSEVSVELSLSAIRLGGEWNAVGIIRDITERMQAEQDRVARKAAEEASRAKSTFLSNMSHEIRTPLNAIIGFSQILHRDPSLSPKQLEKVQTIARSGEHLLKLINNILDLSKIEAGRFNLNPADFSLHDLLEDLENMLSYRAQQKGLQFLMEISPSVPAFARGDENKLRQVFINLVGNAIKFTEKGGIAIRVRGEPEKAGPKNVFFRLRVEVEDTGPGIPSEDLPHIFESFKVSQAGISQGGTGLGLTISKNLVEMMGGKIGVKSQAGRGTVFRFNILLETASGTQRDKKKESPNPIGLKSGTKALRILVVDDQEDNRELLRALLEPVGFHVKLAKNGKEAIEMNDSWSPHAILMDLRMPVMDGYEATRRIRAGEKASKVPIIAVTASAFEDDEKKVLASGVDGYVRKPLRIEDIFKELQRLLGVEFIYEREPMVSPPPVSGKPLSREDMEKIPRELVSEMYRAVEQGEMVRFKQLIARVAQQNEEVAKGLQALAKKFAYDTLLQLLENREG